MGPRTSLNRRGKFRPYRDSIPGSSIPVATRTGPIITYLIFLRFQVLKIISMYRFYLQLFLIIMQLRHRSVEPHSFFYISQFLMHLICSTNKHISLKYFYGIFYLQIRISHNLNNYGLTLLRPRKKFISKRITKRRKLFKTFPHRASRILHIFVINQPFYVNFTHSITSPTCFGTI